MNLPSALLNMNLVVDWKVGLFGTNFPVQIAGYQDKELAQIRQEAGFFMWKWGELAFVFVGFLGWKGFQQVLLLTFPF